MNRLIVLLVGVLTMSSCFKSTAFDTTCIIDPHVQYVSGEDYISLAGTKCYALEGTTDEWTILSYDEALEGIFTSEITGEKRSATVEGVPYDGSETKMSIYLDKEEMILLVVDPASEIYTYRDYSVPQNFYELNISVTFLPWKVADYTASSWKFVVPPFETLEYVLSVYEQAESDSETESLVGTKCHIFEASTSEWQVASYDDALAGTITNIESGETMNSSIEVSAYDGSASDYVATLEEGTVMIVVVDPATETYAYSSYTITAKVRTDSGSVTFYPWKADSYTLSGWTYVMPVVESPEEEEESLEDGEESLEDGEESLEEGEESDEDATDESDEEATE